MRTMSLAPQQVASGKHTKLAIQNIANQPDTLQKIKFFAGERRYSHSYQKTKGLKYPCKIDLENGPAEIVDLPIDSMVDLSIVCS